jgi:uncharacterized protein YigA (DUF484 family)
MSWQVRLGNLDEEIQNFLDNNPEFPIRDEREFVKFAVRKTMTDIQVDEDKLEKERERIKKELKESLEE